MSIERALREMRESQVKTVETLYRYDTRQKEIEIEKIDRNMSRLRREIAEPKP